MHSLSLTRTVSPSKPCGYSPPTLVGRSDSELIQAVEGGTYFFRERRPMNFEQARRRMVQTQLTARGIRQRAILDAMEQVPRESFVPDDLRHQACQDRPLPIGSGQTISQPYVVALMLDELKLKPGDVALEVGTGSGYAAAVMSRIARVVHTIERHPELAKTARDQLRALGYDNVFVHCGDGTRGIPEQAPFDAILVSAAGPAVPEALKAQLAPGGRMVIPVGSRGGQELVRVTRASSRKKYVETGLGSVRFVPLVGAEGWSTDSTPSFRLSARPENRT